MPQTCTVQCSWYLRQKEPANPQSFLTSASSLISELPPSSIAHLPHPPRSLFPLSELFLSPPTLQHPLFPNRSTYPLAHPCTTLSPPPLHPLPPAAPRKSLCPSIPTRISFLKTGKSSSFGYWGWRVGSSRGILDASRQGAKDTGCRTAEDSRARGHEGQAHQKPHPWARVGTSSRAASVVELWEAGEMRQSLSPSPSSHWIKSGRMWPAIFFSALSRLLKFLQQQKYSSTPPYFTWCNTTHNREDHMSSCLFFTWLEWPNNSLRSLKKHFNKYQGLWLEEMGKLSCRKKALRTQVH